MNSRLSPVLTLLLISLVHSPAAASDHVLFHDDFGPESRGERVRNRVVDPPPGGMGYKSDTHYGYLLKKWLIADSEPHLQRRALWCIPENLDGEIEDVGKQVARSHNSIAYARNLIPETVSEYTIEFRQWCHDNDTIGFILGASQPVMEHDGVEFSYQRQLPGTDTTVDDAYYRGALGEGRLEGKAYMRQWVNHRIHVRDQTIRWFQNDELMLEGEVEELRPGGYFGIRQRYERGTRYDDVRITCPRPPVPPENRPPGVLFIAIDDLRTDLGSYGNSSIHSPNIDRLARQGVKFERAYCQYPLCNPSRASVLTGLRPDTTGSNRNGLNNSFQFREKLPAVVTLPQRFQRAGYRVGRIGKLYHYGVPREIGKESALDDRRSWQFALYPRGDEKDEEYRLISYTPEKSSGWALSWQKSKVPADRHTDGKVVTEAIRKLRELRDEPFFLAVGLYRPHVPSTAPAEFFEHYPLEDVELPEEPAHHLETVPPAALDPRLRVDTRPENLRRFKRAYLATISLVDRQVGRLLEALDELGLAENTIVVLWSDHGFMLGEHGQWEKRVLFEESVRVPLIIRSPGARGNGRACSRVVELVDLYPTLAELCGLSAPDSLEGSSLAPLLENPDASWKDVAFSQVARDDAVGHGICTPRWRYTEWNGGELGAQLYDHQIDPHEYVNLVGSKEHARVIADLKKRLREHFRPTE